MQTRNDAQMLMLKIMVLLFFTLWLGGLGGCAGSQVATTDPVPVINTDGTVVVPVPPAQTPLQEIADALGKLADHPLLLQANKDAADTLKWVKGPNGPTDPLYVFRASACPTAIQLATANLKQQIAVLQGLILEKDAALQGLGKDGPEIVLALTKKRYGPTGAPGSDPQALIAMMKHDVAERVTAVVDSCRAIIPIKQIDSLVRAAGKAGLMVGTGGAVSPLMGILP